MSNLTLPTMTYESLNKRVGDKRGPVKLAYETTAEYHSGDDVYVIRHHGNEIAAIGEDHFTLDNAGWDSQTTANRLDWILQSHRTAEDYRVRARKLHRSDDSATTAIWIGSTVAWSFDHGVARFTRTRQLFIRN